MKSALEDALDKVVNKVARGASIDASLAHLPPRMAEEIRPLAEMAAGVTMLRDVPALPADRLALARARFLGQVALAQQGARIQHGLRGWLFGPLGQGMLVTVSLLLVAVMVAALLSLRGSDWLPARFGAPATYVAVSDETATPVPVDDTAEGDENLTPPAAPLIAPAGTPTSRSPDVEPSPTASTMAYRAQPAMATATDEAQLLASLASSTPSMTIAATGAPSRAPTSTPTVAPSATPAITLPAATAVATRTPTPVRLVPTSTFTAALPPATPTATWTPEPALPPQDTPIPEPPTVAPTDAPPPTDTPAPEPTATVVSSVAPHMPLPTLVLTAVPPASVATPAR